MNISEKCFNELVELVEEIINEVSVGALARATENNAEKRKENSDKALKTYYKAQDEYEKAAKKHPEEEPALYRRLQDVDKAACKEFDKNTHAQALKDLNLPKDSKVSANKLFKAANKVEPKRDKEYDEVTGQSDSKKFWKGMRRWNRANDIVYADPVKSRNEALEETLEIIEAVINEISDETANSFLEKRVKNAVDAWYNDDKLNKKEDDAVKALIKRKERQGKKLSSGEKAKLEEALEVLSYLLGESKSPEEVKEVANKVLPQRKREYLSKYANVLDAADIDGSENVPDGDMKDLERAEKRYKHAKKGANEALEETLKILELFDRPDLLDDIDTDLGSPVKKTFKKAISSVATPKKEVKVKECEK